MDFPQISKLTSLESSHLKRGLQVVETKIQCSTYLWYVKSLGVTTGDTLEKHKEPQEG